MRIYIIGCPGTGKTTIAKYLSKNLRIKNYELDCIIYDDKNNHKKREDAEINDLFQKIIKKPNWIIEDVGRNKFIEGRELADKIYYIKLPKRRVYKRVIIRWIKQKKGKIPYNYPPTLKSLFEMLKWVKLYSKREEVLLKELNKYKDKLRIINNTNLKIN